MDRNNENNSFKVPEGYFDSLADQIMDKVAMEAPIESKNEGFKVPEGYFDSLEDKIHQKLKEGDTQVIALNPYKKYYYIAASVAAVVLVFLGIQWNVDGTPTYSDLANTDIENYFEFDDLGISSYELAEMLPIDEMDMNDMLTHRIEDENIVDYINSNIDDFEELNLHDNE